MKNSVGKRMAKRSAAAVRQERAAAHRRMFLKYLRRPSEKNLEAAVAAFIELGHPGGRDAAVGFGLELERLTQGDHDEWLRLLGAALRSGDHPFYASLKRLSPFAHMLIAVVDRGGDIFMVRGDIDRLLDAWRRRGLKYVR
jgi:hypothetical protein